MPEIRTTCPQLCAELLPGGPTFRVDRVEHRLFPPVTSSPVLLLPGGEALHTFQSNGRQFLLLDHRRDPAIRARVEFWVPTARLEGDVAGLYVLCDARRHVLTHPAHV